MQLLHYPFDTQLTLTPITLFDNLAIPTAMVISRCLFSREYTWVHFSGALICMVGVVLNTVQDYDDDQNVEEQQEYPHKLQGDLCAITGDILHTEADDNGDGATCHTERWWMLATYVGCTAFANMGASRFFQISEATFFSLSLLTGDLWSVLYSILCEHITPHPLFFLTLLFVLAGMVMYEMAPSPVLDDRIVDDSADPYGLNGPANSSGNGIDPSSDYVAAALGDEEVHNSTSDGRLT